MGRGKAPSTRMRETGKQKCGCEGRKLASPPRGQVQGGRRRGSWSVMGPFPASVGTVQIARSVCQLSAGGLMIESTFSETMVLITSAGSVPSNSVMIKNWLMSESHQSRLDTHTLRHDSRSVPQTMVFPLASPQRYIQRSICLPRCHTVATSK